MSLLRSGQFASMPSFAPGTRDLTAPSLVSSPLASFAYEQLPRKHESA